MLKYEYKVREYPDIIQMENGCNDMAVDGWRVVAVSLFVIDGLHRLYTVTFER